MRDCDGASLLRANRPLLEVDTYKASVMHLLVIGPKTAFAVVLRKQHYGYIGLYAVQPSFAVKETESRKRDWLKTENP